jgi:hypothetical protein
MKYSREKGYSNNELITREQKKKKQVITYSPRKTKHYDK